MRKFLALRQKVEAGEIKIAPAQEAGWKTTTVRFASVTRQLEKLIEEIRNLKTEEEYLGNQVEKLEAARAQAEQAVSCCIKEITGDTIVRTRTGPVEGLLFDQLTPKELHVRLRESGGAEYRLHAADSGSFQWHLKATN